MELELFWLELDGVVALELKPLVSVVELDCADELGLEVLELDCPEMLPESAVELGDVVDEIPLEPLEAPDLSWLSLLLPGPMVVPVSELFWL